MVVNNGDGTFDYDPNGQFDSLTIGQTATDTFGYTLSDGNGGTNDAIVTVTITSAAENTAPSITSLATASVAEAQTVAIDVAATDDLDSEGSGLVYSITGGADQSLFSINASSGLVVFNNAPDFENPGDADTNNIYLLQVTVQDKAFRQKFESEGFR